MRWVEKQEFNINQYNLQDQRRKVTYQNITVRQLKTIIVSLVKILIGLVFPVMKKAQNTDDWFSSLAVESTH